MHTIRYVPRYICHSYLGSRGLWSRPAIRVLHSTYYNCLRSNDAQWLQQWRPPRSFQMQCVCEEFTQFIGIYWLLSVISRVCFNFGMCYICTILYRIVLGAYRDTYHSLCIGDIPVCRCIVSALLNKLCLWDLGGWQPIGLFAFVRLVFFRVMMLYVMQLE